MLTLRPPLAAEIDAFVGRQRGAPFSYPSVGGTRPPPPRSGVGEVTPEPSAEAGDGAPEGYAADHHRVKVGEGARTFARAVDAVRRWEMFNIGWVTLCWPTTPIEAGRTVAILVPLAAVWSLNACRIVYVIDERDERAGAAPRFGFAYGTLDDHMESGEERFSVEWHRDDDSVWYDLFAFSRPKHPLAWAGYPLTRMLQRRFAGDSKAALARALGGEKAIR